MDLVRSCYVTTMSFDLAGVLTAPVRWFFTDPNAEIFPGPHLFGSRNYQTCPDEALGPGEVWNAARPWSNGRRPPVLKGTGPVCGNLAWFFTGVPSTAPRLQVDASGIPICCGVGGIGGLRTGATIPDFCQPYFTTTRPRLAGPLWNYALQDFGGNSDSGWFNPSDHNQIIEAFAGGPPCSGLAAATVVRSVDNNSGGTAPPCVLLAYYPPQHLGLWQVPLTATFLPGARLWLKFGQPPYVSRGGLRIGATSPTGRKLYLGAGGILLNAEHTTQERDHPYGGLLPGGKSTLAEAVSAEGGLLPGGYGVRSLTYHYVTTGGLKLGATSFVRQILPGPFTGGLRLGATSHSRVPRSSTGGLQPGATSTVAKAYTAAGGLKLGATSAVRLRFKQKGGIELGATSNGYQGVYTSCCPGRVIPFTLYVTDTATSIKYTAAFNSGQSRWNFTGPSSLAFAVECTTLSSTLTFFVLHIPPPTCVNSVSGITHSCTGSTLCTHTLTLGGGSCGGLSGSHWTFRITTI